MIATQASPQATVLSFEERLGVWSQIDRPSDLSDLLSCDEEEIAEIRRVTERNLREISRQSRLDPVRDQHALAYVDAASIAGALQRVAEQRMERGDYDLAAQSAVTALQWYSNARLIHRENRLRLPVSDPTRLWMLLVEIYSNLGESALVSQTVHRIVAEGDVGTVPSALRLMRGVSVEDSRRAQARSILHAGRGARVRLRTVAAIWILVALVGLIVLLTVKAQAHAKAMIDNSSIGIEYLEIALRDGTSAGDDDSMVLASQEFAALNARIGGWSWLIPAASVIPQIGTQFDALEGIADLGPRVVALGVARNGGTRLGAPASPSAVCRPAMDLKSVQGNLLDQLEENRQAILKLSVAMTGDLCHGVTRFGDS